MRKIASSILLGTIAQIFPRVAQGPDGPFTVLDLIVANNAVVNGRDVPTYLDVSLTGSRADYVKDRLEKGVHVMITGVPSQDKWTNGGQDFARFKLKAVRMDILPATLAVTAPDKKGLRRLKDGINQTIIVGNVTAPPTRGTLPRTQGEAEVVYAEFGVAMNAFKRDADGKETEEKTVDYLNVRVWREEAERVLATLDTGSPVSVTGGLLSKIWTDRVTKKYRSATWLEAGFVSLLELDTAAQGSAPQQTEDNLPPVSALEHGEVFEAEHASA